MNNNPSFLYNISNSGRPQVLLIGNGLERGCEPTIPDPKGVTEQLSWDELVAAISVKGCAVNLGNETTEDYSSITVDLTAEDDDRIVYATPDAEVLNPDSSISLSSLVSSDILPLVEKYGAYIKKIDDYRKLLNGQYRFSKIDFEDATINVATEVFTRLNI